MVKMNENCSYVNGCGNSKNCYLVFDTDFCEDSYYSNIIKHSKNIVDCSHIYYSDTCYHCINCSESYDLISCYECDQSKYLRNCSLCSQCEHCYSCHNLVGKKYCIDNKQLTQEVYEEQMKSYQFSPRYPFGVQRASYQVNAEGSYGNNIYSSKDSILSYNIGFSEHLKYCDLVTDCHDSYDISSFGGTTNHCLECCSIGLDCSRIYFSNIITAGSHTVFYSSALLSCQYMFGCSFMQNASYCIFNKQYTKEEWHELVPQLIESMIADGQWGEFLDPSLSPFGYNETVAMDYYPLDRQEATRLGYQRSDYEQRMSIPEGAPVIKPQAYTPQERAVLRDDDTITNQIIVCEVSSKPFRIVQQELVFYRKHNIPLPTKHPDIRHAERMAHVPKRHLTLDNCGNCDKTMLNVHSDQSDVYCEQCYNSKVYG
jgi:hypothetical protein